jgi:S1-C subfamily serine protease
MFKRHIHMTLLIMVALATTFCGVATAQQSQRNRNPISLRLVTAATVLIESTSSGGIAQGSGVVTMIMGKKYVLTANHVIQGTSVARLTSLADGSSGFSNKTGGWHVKYDIAAIVLPKELNHLPAIPLYRAKLRPGSRVYIAAFPKGVPVITIGQVAGYTAGGTQMYHTAATTGGSSGGMIIDAAGNLCGVHLGVDTSLGYKYATPSDLIIRLVNTHGRK